MKMVNKTRLQLTINLSNSVFFEPGRERSRLNQMTLIDGETGYIYPTFTTQKFVIRLYILYCTGSSNVRLPGNFQAAN